MQRRIQKKATEIHAHTLMYIGAYEITSLKSTSLHLRQNPAFQVGLTWMVCENRIH